jgi:hypothetical protein
MSELYIYIYIYIYIHTYIQARTGTEFCISLVKNELMVTVSVGSVEIGERGVDECLCMCRTSEYTNTYVFSTKCGCVHKSTHMSAIQKMHSHEKCTRSAKQHTVMRAWPTDYPQSGQKQSTCAHDNAELLAKVGKALTGQISQLAGRGSNVFFFRTEL